MFYIDYIASKVPTRVDEGISIPKLCKKYQLGVKRTMRLCSSYMKEETTIKHLNPMFDYSLLKTFCRSSLIAYFCNYCRYGKLDFYIERLMY